MNADGGALRFEFGKGHSTSKIFDIRVHPFLSAFICVKTLSFSPWRVVGGTKKSARA
jgi:hypothetical protein